MLLPGIQRPELDPRLKHSGVTVLGVASLDPQPNFRRRARRSRRIWLSMILNFVLFVLLCFGILAAWANFSGRKTPDSAALYPGYEPTGAQSALYEYVRDLRALRGEGLFSFGCGSAALGLCAEDPVSSSCRTPRSCPTR